MLPGMNLPDESPAGDRAAGRTQSLYRAHRPRTFADDELVGQEHVTQTLRNAIARGRVAHAYLFCGPRGTGKTSTARLLAKAVNCLAPDPADRPCNACEACRAINSGSATDIIEIDAASNRGIDDIRSLREQARFAPAQLGTKFYILDEAHRLSRDAFDALLKTLEEPPPKTVFVLATTEVDKLPATIASRCQRFDFRRIPAEQAAAHVRRVCAREGIEIDDEALAIVTRQATGSLRDALSLVDLLATAAGEAGGVISGPLARRMLGLSHDDRAIALVEALAERDVAAGLRAIGDAVEAGLEMRTFGRQVLGLLRTLLLTRAGATPPEADEATRRLAERFELPDLLRINREFSEQDYAIRNGGFPQLPLELALVAAIVGPARPAQAAPTQLAPAPAPARPRPATEQPPERRLERPVELPRERAPQSRPAASQQPPQREPTPLRRPAPAAARGGGDALGRVLAVWERIRTEVKVVDVRTEALLAASDPVAYDGQHLTLVVPYPFHAGKLNEAKTRQRVEDAVARVLGEPASVTTITRDELDARPQRSTGNARAAAPVPVTDAPPPAAAPPPAPAQESFTEAPPADDAEDPVEALVRTGKALFVAEEVDPDELPEE